MQIKKMIVGTGDEGKRLDQYIADASGLSRSQVQKAIARGMVTVSGAAAKKDHRVKPGESVTLAVERDERRPGLVPEDIPLEIVYRDASLVVINKPHDLVMYPAAGHASGTLMNAVAFHSGELASAGGPLRPGVVHRLDKDTSGLVVVALTDKAYYSLQGQFKSRSIIRDYLAVVYGKMKSPSGEINASIGRALSDRKKMSTRTRSGKPAITFYTVIEEYRNASLVRARLATGRTHQIRVHFASLGHPVLGDRTYGGKTSIQSGGNVIRIPRQMLHAQTLGFVHPATGEKMEFTSPPPRDMELVIKELKTTVN